MMPVLAMLLASLLFASSNVGTKIALADLAIVASRLWPFPIRGSDTVGHGVTNPPADGLERGPAAPVDGFA